MHRFFYAAAVIVGILMITPVEAATLTSAQATELNALFIITGQTLNSVENRVNANSINATQESNIQATLGAMRNTLFAMSADIAALSVPAQPPVQTAPAARAILPAPQVSALSEADANAQSTNPVESEVLTPQNETPVVIDTQNEGVTETAQAGSWFTRPAFWITLGVIALLTLVIRAIAAGTPRARTAFAAKREDRELPRK